MKLEYYFCGERPETVRFGGGLEKNAYIPKPAMTEQPSNVYLLHKEVFIVYLQDGDKK